MQIPEMALNQLKEKGFLDLEVDPTLDLLSEIRKLKLKKNAVILAHYYQQGEIQDIADFIGDSLQLSQEAAATDADIILFAGVHFMAETAKILSPEKKVILPDLNAGCSLADSCPPELFRLFKSKHPNALVVSYVNCTAELKTLTDICCTSSNAVKVIESIPQDREIIFAPDRNLGAYLKKKTGRNLILWNGTCMVHEIFSEEKITKLLNRHPMAELIAHPECEETLLNRASFIGSTSQLLKYTKESSKQTFIVATEPGIIHQMAKSSPEKTFIPAPPQNNCACNECPHMKRNTLEKIYLALKFEMPEILLPDSIIRDAKASITRMLDLS